MRRKSFGTRLLVGGPLLIGLTLLGGCKQKPVPTAKANEGLVITIAGPGGIMNELVANYAKAWAVETGACVNTVAVASSERPLSADIWLISPNELPRWAASGEILPIPDTFLNVDGAYFWRDLLPLYRNKLLLWNHQAMGVPILGSVPVCYYRTDLLADPARQAAFLKKYHRELNPPTTWEQFVEIAEFFKGTERPGAAPPFPSLPPLAQSDGDLGREFYCMAAPYDRRGVKEDAPHPNNRELFSFHFDLETLAPRINGPAFQEALQLLIRLQPCRAPGTVEHPENAFRSGNAVLCIAGTEWTGRFQDEISPIRGRFAVCRVPGSRRIYDFRTGKPQELSEVNYVSYLGADGWLAVVSKSSAHPDAAFNLLAHLTGEKTSAEMILEPAWARGVYRRQHFSILDGSDFQGLARIIKEKWLETVHQTVTPTIINPVISLRVPSEREYAHVLAKELLLIASPNQIESAKILEAVTHAWRNLNQTKSESDRRAEYRLSLNLKP